MKKLNLLLLFTIFISTHLFSLPFNSKLTEEDLTKINNGEVLIKNIKYKKNMSLNKDINALGDKLFKNMDTLEPKYLAEIIQVRPYNGNEDLPQRLEEILKAIPSYVGIPYFSERKQKWYDLYSSAEITKEETIDNITYISADVEMAPFGVIKEEIEIEKNDDGFSLFAAFHHIIFDALSNGIFKQDLQSILDGNAVDLDAKLTEYGIEHVLNAYPNS